MQVNHGVVLAQKVACRLQCPCFDQDRMQSGSEAAGKQDPQQFCFCQCIFLSSLHRSKVLSRTSDIKHEGMRLQGTRRRARTTLHPGLHSEDY